MSAHTRTWNLKAGLGPKPCKVNQQYQHKNVNPHVLAEEVSKNTNKNQFPKEVNFPIMSNLQRHPDTKINEDPLGEEVPC